MGQSLVPSLPDRDSAQSAWDQLMSDPSAREVKLTQQQLDKIKEDEKRIMSNLEFYTGEIVRKNAQIVVGSRQSPGHIVWVSDMSHLIFK